MPALSARKPDAATPAIAAIVIALFALSFGDAMIKAYSPRFTLWQIFVLRSAFALPVLIGLLFLRRRSIVRPLAPAWIVLRGMLFAGAGITFFTSLLHLPFSTAAAILNTAPFFVIWFAANLGHETAPRVAKFAVAFGFAGVLLIVRPDVTGFNYYALLTLAAAILYAGAMVVTRVKCRYENPYTLSCGMHIVFIAVGAAVSGAIECLHISTAAQPTAQFLLNTWRPIGRGEIYILAAMAAGFVVYTVGAAVAYKRAAAATIAPFEYAYLAASLLWGYLFFVEFPDPLALGGMLMIVIGGLTVLKYQHHG